MKLEQITNKLAALVKKGVPNRSNSEENLDNNLESTIEDSFKEPSRLKKYLVNTFAGQTFHQPLFFSIELFMIYALGRMDLEKSLYSRRNAFFIGLVANYGYGKFRDYWAGIWTADAESSKRKKWLVDTTAKIIFEGGLYAGNLAVNRVTMEDMYIAVPLGLAIHFSLGAKYGQYLDYLKKWFGIKPTLYTY